MEFGLVAANAEIGVEAAQFRGRGEWETLLRAVLVLETESPEASLLKAACSLEAGSAQTGNQR
jgi:hypothetical protein